LQTDDDALNDPARIEAALALMEWLRGEMDDALLDLALSPLRERLDALRSGEHPEQRLKQVTVMFCDVVGSTALGHQLDPEDINAVMDTALERYTAIVERWQGRVLQYTGDGLLAAFGTAQVREDDAERAVAAGLGIVAETTLHAERVRRKLGHAGFGVRVGLHSGPVLLGGGVDGDNTIRGTTVNLAARMEQNALPGTLRVSADTWRLCAGLFEGTEQAPLVVKGRSEPMRTWLVERRRPRQALAPARGVAGRPSPLVGREAELQALCEAWQRLHASGAATQVLTVLGEAGLGKSRLEQTFEAWAHTQPQVALWLRARCQPQTQAQPYGLLRDLLAGALALPDTDSPAQARERFTAAVAPLFAADAATEAEPAAHVLGHLLGLNFADSPHVQGLLGGGGHLRTLAYHAAAEVLRRLAQGRARPLLLQVEDLHWADSASLHFLRHLAALPAGLPTGVPTWVLALARPTLDEVDPLWRGIEQQRVLLQALLPAQRDTLASALLAPLPVVPPELRTLLVERAAGNPFYMEELVQMLLDRGALVVQAQDAAPVPPSTPNTEDEHTPAAARWRFVPERLDAERLPPTLTGVLQARLDLLPTAERRALQHAAVLGLVFGCAPLQVVSTEAGPHLQHLVQRGLLLAQPGDALDTDERFAFAHQLLHQVAYESLLKRDRREAHARAAHWYAELQTTRAAAHRSTAADHFERAELPLLAAQHSLLAAEELATRFAHEAVAEQAGRALRLAAADDHAARWRMLLVRQRALRHAGQNEAQWQDLDALDLLAQRTGEPLHHATVAVRRTVALAESGEARRAADLAPQALALAREAGDELMELSAYNAWAGALRASGEHAQATQVATEALQRARATGLKAMESELLIGLAAVATESGDLAQAERLARQALAIDREQHNRIGECVGLINLGANALQRGDFGQARADLADAMVLSRATGRRSFEASIHLNLSALALAEGDAAGAAAAADAGARVAALIGHREYAAFAQLSRGAALLALAQTAEAAAAFAGARDALTALGQPHLAIEAVAGSVLVATALGEGPKAAALAAEVHTHWQQHGHFNGTERPLVLCLAAYDALAAAGDSRAQDLLQCAWAELQQQAARLAAGATRERFLQAHAAHRRLCALAASGAVKP
jgi:class 3 adenylate cyclase/predicted ATPase